MKFAFIGSVIKMFIDVSSILYRNIYFNVEEFFNVFKYLYEDT